MLYLPVAIAALSQLPYDLVNLKLQSVRNASQRGALCGDGSPAKYYFRDCPRPGYECLTSTDDWIIVFADADLADVCYDKETCDARRSLLPERMTSSGLNETLLSPGGIFSWSGEVNPNFYQHRTVFVPYCSSDLWVGNESAAGFEFRGKAIAKAVMEDLAAETFTPVSVPTPYGPGPNTTRLEVADSFTFVGGPGLMSILPLLIPLLPPRPRKYMRAILDGGVVVDIPPKVSLDQLPCNRSVADCPPTEVLRRGVPVWDVEAGEQGWKKLLAPQLLPGIPVPALVQQSQYDERQLRQLRGWPVESASDAYAAQFAASVRSTLRSYSPQGEGSYTFSTACATRDSAFYRNDTEFFCLPVTCVLKGNATATRKLSSVTSEFLKEMQNFNPVCLEDCGSVNCNAYCAQKQCWGP
eukprot:Hpha_TRINITY_DN7438_c0_g1::TRINITY_DN7438_c0_g1_i1::g.95836::m.95836/K19882/NOTUM; O-palmitoleoyl-L-serine hydrolase